MDAKRLEEIKALLPIHNWFVDEADNSVHERLTDGTSMFIADVTDSLSAEFIAAASDTIRELVAEVERLQKFAIAVHLNELGSVIDLYNAYGWEIYKRLEDELLEDLISHAAKYICREFESK